MEMKDEETIKVHLHFKTIAIRDTFMKRFTPSYRRLTNDWRKSSRQRMEPRRDRAKRFGSSSTTRTTGRATRALSGLTGTKNTPAEAPVRGQEPEE